MNSKHDSKIDIAYISQVEEKNTNKEEPEIYEGENTIKKMDEILNVYKDGNKHIDYKSINKDQFKELSTLFSSLHWIDQIRFRLNHLTFSELIYPQIKDNEGFKFSKKNHEVTKKKATVYYYCEAYKSCTVGIKLNFEVEGFKFKEVKKK